MRTIDAIVKSVIEDEQIPYTLLLRATFKTATIAPNNDNVLRLSMSSTSVFWDERGVGDKEYVGVGNALSLSTIEEGLEVQQYVLQATLTGIPIYTTYIQDILDLEYKNEPFIIYLAILDEEHTVQFDTNEEDGPVILFAGRMDTMSISLGETAEVTMQVSSRMAEWERPRGGRYNQATQQAFYDLSNDANFPSITTTDKGFEYIEELKNKEIRWGAFRARAGSKSLTRPGDYGDLPGANEIPK